MLQILRRHAVALLLAALFLTGCTHGTPTRTTATVTPTLGPELAADDPIHAALAALPAVSAIGIANDWNGLSLYSPIETHYRLTRQGDHFNGISRAIINQPIGPPLVTVVDTIYTSADQAQEALTILAGAALRIGPYQPTIAHFDNYPSIRLAFDTPAGLLTFFSRSNSKISSMQPWGASFGGRTYVVADDAPERAIRLLPGDLRPTGYVPSRAQRTGTPTASDKRDSLFCQQPPIPGDPLVAPLTPLDGAPYTPTAGKYLDGIVTVSLNSQSIRESHVWSDSRRIAALIAIFDRPLPRAADSGALAWSDYDTIEIRLQMADYAFVTVVYNPYLDVLRWKQGRAGNGATISTFAPPDLRTFLLAEICGA